MFSSYYFFDDSKKITGHRVASGDKEVKKRAEVDIRGIERSINSFPAISNYGGYPHRIIQTRP